MWRIWVNVMISPRPGVYCGSAGRRPQLVKFVKNTIIDVITNVLDMPYVLKRSGAGLQPARDPKRHCCYGIATHHGRRTQMIFDRQVRYVFFGLIIFGMAGPTVPHPSFAGFAPTRAMNILGTVTQWEWSKPPAYFDIHFATFNALFL